MISIVIMFIYTYNINLLNLFKQRCLIHVQDNIIEKFGYNYNRHFFQNENHDYLVRIIKRYWYTYILYIIYVFV